MRLRKYLAESARRAEFPVKGDTVGFVINEEALVEMPVVYHNSSEVVFEADDLALEVLENCGCSLEEDFKDMDAMMDIVGKLAAHKRAAGQEVTVRKRTGPQPRREPVDPDLEPVVATPADSKPTGDPSAYYASKKPGEYTGDSVERDEQPIQEEPVQDQIRNLKQKLAALESSDSELEEDGKLSSGADDPCWKGYEMVGTKKKNGKEVPNCVPKESVEQDSYLNEGVIDQLRNIVDTKSAQRIQFDNGESVTVDLFTASSIANLYNAVNDINKAKIENSISKNQAMFAKIADFAMKQAGTNEDLDEAEYQGKDVELNQPMRGDVKKYKVYVKDPKTGNVKKVNFGSKEMEIKRDDPERRKSFRARHKCSDKTFEKDRTSAGYWSCRMWSSKPVSDILKGK